MTLNNHCVCMVDTCWRHGICQLCANNHNHKMETLSCRLSPQEYQKRKQAWERLHDEPVYPMDSELGILSKYTQDAVKDAALSLKECLQRQKALEQSLHRVQENVGALADMDASTGAGVDVSEVAHANGDAGSNTSIEAYMEELQEIHRLLGLAMQQAKAAVRLAQALAPLANSQL